MLFTDEHAARMQRQGAVEQALRHADLAGEGSLAFQPMVDVRQGRAVAFEALARWDSPLLGRVPPDQFILDAERIGLINEVTAVLFAKALDAVAGWPPEVSLSVNLSMADKPKIDQSFTREFATTEAARSIVASILGLARTIRRNGNPGAGGLADWNAASVTT